MRRYGACAKVNSANVNRVESKSRKPGSRRFPTPDYVWNAKKRKRRLNLADISNRQLILPSLFLVAIVVADQLSKLWALKALADNQTHQVLGQFLQLKLVYNRGGALGTNFGGGLFYLISSLIILVVIFHFVMNNKEKLMMTCPMGVIGGGAIGNIIDRIRLGKVVDFLDFDIPDINLFGYRIERWWTFNVADSAITVGVIFLLIYMIFLARREKSASTDIQSESQKPSGL
jgi:signal peptidase II